jgi:hypothetical protein
MDAHPVARSAASGERTTTMAEMRRCIGSERFGIAAHDAPIEAFPKQPSQGDGLGRMCAEHWRTYTAGLARDAKVRKAAATTEEGVTEAEETRPTPKRRRPKPAPVADSEEAAT